jgi:signal transduction histidine kinase
MHQGVPRRLPSWFWQRPVGLLGGPLCALLLTLAIDLFNGLVTTIPNPGLLYLFIILAFAYGGVDGSVSPPRSCRFSLADGALVLDRQGDLVQVNEAMRRLCGGDIPQTIATRCERWNMRNADHSPLVGGGPTPTALAGMVTTELAMLIDTPDGRELPISVSGAPIRSRSGAITGGVIVCRDMSKMQRLQEAKDDFLSIASHELKTPLTSLRGYTQLLQQRLLGIGPADERTLRYLTTIDNQTRRVAELVDTLLDVSRLDAGRLQLRRDRFDLVALVREAAAQVGELSSRHTIVVQAEVPTLVGDWDRDRIEQIVVNLLTNAVRYSPGGGEISVTVATRPRDRATAEGELDALVRVRDGGVGIAHDQLEAIFERFHRVHEGALRGFAEAQRGMLSVAGACPASWRAALGRIGRGRPGGRVHPHRPAS